MPNYSDLTAINVSGVFPIVSFSHCNKKKADRKIGVTRGRLKEKKCYPCKACFVGGIWCPKFIM